MLFFGGVLLFFAILFNNQSHDSISQRNIFLSELGNSTVVLKQQHHQFKKRKNSLKPFCSSFLICDTQRHKQRDDVSPIQRVVHDIRRALHIFFRRLGLLKFVIISDTNPIQCQPQDLGRFER